MSESDAQKSFLQKLWNRRFFQYLATYLGVSWGLIQFLEWLVNRYNFNSSWVDNLVIFLFAMLPGMAIFIYLHGRPGHDAWKPFEKIVYPINLVVAIMASFFIFDGTAAQKTRQIEVTNELGDTITRVIPSQEYTNRVVFFPFESDLDQQESWMEYGIPILADFDIEQDMTWYSVRPTSLRDEYLDNGLELGDDIPFATRLQIASDLYCDFFVIGSLSKIDGALKAEIKVYNAVNGKERISAEFSGKNLYQISDQISTEVREKINKIKLDEVDSYIDLPSSDLVTGNLDAFKNYVLAQIKIQEGVGSYPQALQYIQKSVNQDPNCAECQSFLMVLQRNTGLEGKEAIASAIEKGINLPERQKLRFNYYNYQVNRDPEKMTKLLEMWKKLYPQDIYPYEQLVNFYKASLAFDKAENIAKEALDNGHTGKILLTAANLNILTRDFEEAENYVNQFISKYPKKAKNNTLLGDIYIAKGELENGLKIFEENMIMNPNDLENLLKIAQAQFKLLNFESTSQTFSRALSIANTHNDSLNVYLNILGYAGRFGIEDLFTPTLQSHKQLYYRNFPKQGYITSLFQLGGFYSKIEGSSKLEDIVKESLDITPEFSKDFIIILIDYLMATWNNDAEAYAQAYEKAKPLLSASGEKSTLAMGDAILNYFNNDYENALKYFLEFEEYAKAFSLESSDLIIDCFINLGKLDEGLNHIETRLERDRNHPLGLFSKFQLLIKMGKTQQAKEMIPLLDRVYSLTSELWEDKIKYKKLKQDIET